jgi:hypothetical protein
LHVCNNCFNYLSHLFLLKLRKAMPIYTFAFYPSKWRKTKTKHLIYFLTSYVFVLTSDNSQFIKLIIKKTTYFMPSTLRCVRKCLTVGKYDWFSEPTFFLFNQIWQIPVFIYLIMYRHAFLGCNNFDFKRMFLVHFWSRNLMK